MNFKHKNYEFIHYDLVRLPTGKMSSRTGENILYSSFIKELIDYSKQEIKKRFPKLSGKELDKRALAISIAAIKYDFLKQGPNKVIVFVKEDALNFEGESGPYLQYSYARASSILRKAKSKKSKAKTLKSTSLSESEISLIKKLGDFPQVVGSAEKHLSPNLVANYSFELAQIFNEFYHTCPVIGSENESFRLKLVEAFRITIKKSLYLLGIEVMEEM